MEINPLELLGVVLNLTFVILMINQKILAWPFGILGSLISIYLVWEQSLYSESILYSYYVFMGIYGWIHWTKKNDIEIPILTWKLKDHLILISVSITLALIQGYLFSHFTEAKNPFVDAFTTIFSFSATYMQARKVLSSWVYWLLINAVSVGLYFVRGLPFYAIQMIVFSVLSVVGFLKWKKEVAIQKN